MPHLRTLLLALCAVVVPALPGCSVVTGSDARFVTMQVAGVRTDCTGAYPTKCLLVKTDLDSAGWSRFYDPIQGFDWEPGYEYVLLVSVRTIDNPPADGSSLEYHLVSVLKKTPSVVPPTGT